jgi:hypothetical protein
MDATIKNKKQKSNSISQNTFWKNKNKEEFGLKNSFNLYISNTIQYFLFNVIKKAKNS